MLWRQAPSPAIEAALTRVRLFAALAPRDLRRLARACTLKDYAPGEEILREGGTGLGLFIITSGRVEVFKTIGERRIQLAVLGHGDVLGEMALLDDQPRSASAMALAATECLLLSRARFRALLKTRPRIAWPIVPALARRVRDLQQRLIEAQSRDPRADAAAPDDAEMPVGATPGGATPGGAAPEGATPGGATPGGATPGGAAPEGATSGGVTPRGATPGGARPPAPEPRAATRTAAARGSASSSSRSLPLDPLRAQYALIRTGVTGLDESARLLEIFLRALEEEVGIWRGKPLGDAARRLPGAFWHASRASCDAGLQLPTRMLASFRDHLRPGQATAGGGEKG